MSAVRREQALRVPRVHVTLCGLQSLWEIKAPASELTP